MQTLKYICSLLAYPLVGSIVTVICRVHRFRRLKIGKWTFAGPPEFLRLVEEARQTLEKCDSEIIGSMRNPFTMINLAGQPLESFPAWGFGVISDNSITWGVDGVIAAWIYFLNLSLEFGKKRWLMCDSTYRTARWAEARNRTAFWLKQHDYPKELYEVYEMRSSA